LKSTQLRGQCKYFRANVWSWRPIHALMKELCADLLDEETLHQLGFNDGAGPVDQATCDAIASRFEQWMEHHTEGLALDSDLRVTTEGRFVSDEELIANPDRETVSPYEVSDNVLKKWITFLRHCGGFQVFSRPNRPFHSRGGGAMQPFGCSFRGLGNVVFLIGLLFTGTGSSPGWAAPDTSDPKKAEPTPLEGVWELRECDNGGRTIGYHPQAKVSPGYALLMFAHQATSPQKGSDIKGMRWRFAGDKVTVEWLVEEDKKQSRQRLAEFTCRLDGKTEPASLDLTWLPPGLEDLVREEKGQVVPGIYKREDDRLEMVLSHTGKNRPRAFKADRTSYRLVFQKVKDGR
jgi:uncharacterized protein (TIGR03067 family)